MEKEKKKRHESFGTIILTNKYGGERALFGSSIPHSETICISIHRAEETRMLNYDSYTPKEQMIEIEMSRSQFADFITSAGKGTGTPCTILYNNGKRMEECPFTPKAEEHKQEFKEHQTEIRSELTEFEKLISEITNKNSFTKKDKQNLIRAFSHIKSQILSNSEYQVQMFAEQMEKMAHETKTELEAMLRQENKILRFTDNGTDTKDSE